MLRPELCVNNMMYACILFRVNSKSCLWWNSMMFSQTLKTNSASFECTGFKTFDKTSFLLLQSMKRFIYLPIVALQHTFIVLLFLMRCCDCFLSLFIYSIHLFLTNVMNLWAVHLIWICVYFFSWTYFILISLLLKFCRELIGPWLVNILKLSWCEVSSFPSCFSWPSIFPLPHTPQPTRL